jgi:hypothetical protein
LLLQAASHGSMTRRATRAVNRSFIAVLPCLSHPESMLGQVFATAVPGDGIPVNQWLGRRRLVPEGARSVAKRRQESGVGPQLAEIADFLLSPNGDYLNSAGSSE